MTSTMIPAADLYLQAVPWRVRTLVKPWLRV